MEKENIIPEKLKQLLDESKKRVEELDEKWQEESKQLDDTINKLLEDLPQSLRWKIEREIKIKQEQTVGDEDAIAEDIKALPQSTIKKIIKEITQHNETADPRNTVDIEKIKERIAELKNEAAA